MPRIRTVKPEFWTSGQVLECSTNARLLFIGLWNFCDDQGRHAFKPKQIKAEIFPADDFTESDVRGMLQELSENGLIMTYTVENADYLQVCGWHHQRIDKPQPPKHPEPLPEHSTNGLGAFPPDRKGRDSKGVEGKGGDTKVVDSCPPAETADEPEAVITIPLVDKSEYGITEQQITEWAEAYPAIDVTQELRSCRQWNLANSQNRKTRNGVLRHVNSWLSRAQNKAPRVGGRGDDARERARERIFGSEPIEGNSRRVS